MSKHLEYVKKWINNVDKNYLINFNEYKDKEGFEAYPVSPSISRFQVDRNLKLHGEIEFVYQEPVYQESLFMEENTVTLRFFVKDDKVRYIMVSTSQAFDECYAFDSDENLISGPLKWYELNDEFLFRPEYIYDENGLEVPIFGVSGEWDKNGYWNPNPNVIGIPNGGTKSYHCFLDTMPGNKRRLVSVE